MRGLAGDGTGKQFVVTAAEHVGCRWSKSLPVLKIVRKSSKVWSPSGNPVFGVGVKLREIM